MRLPRVETGHRLKYKLFLLMMRVMTLGERPPDVLRTVFYRPEFFGKSFNRYVDQVLRGESSWSVGERELFAAFTSKLNQCPF